MVNLDNYIVNISLPTISKFFNVGTSMISWIVLAYLLALSAFLLISGKLGDSIGFKRVFILGYFIFTAGSLLCGASSTLFMLIGSRCIQGIGGAMLYSIGPAIIPRFLPINIRGWAFGIVFTSAAFGLALGPSLGGFITSFLSWQWIFLINVPVGILAILVSYKVLPGENVATNNKNKSEFDILGAILSFLVLLTLIYALNMGHELGWSSFIILSCFVASVVFLVFFFIREKRCQHPLLDINLFKNRNITYANLANFMALFLLAGSSFLLPFYLELVKNLTADKAGLVIMIYSLVYMPIAPFAGKLSDRMKPNLLCSIAMFSATSASLVFALTLRFSGLLSVVVFLIWLAISYAIFIAPNNTLIMNLSPPNEQGITSSVLRMMTIVGAAFGVCSFETIFSHVIPHEVALSPDNLIQAQISSQALISGFSNSYILGGFICLFGFILSMLIRPSKE